MQNLDLMGLNGSLGVYSFKEPINNRQRRERGLVKFTAQLLSYYGTIVKIDSPHELSNSISGKTTSTHLNS